MRYLNIHKKIILLSILLFVSFVLLSQAGDALAKEENAARYALIKQATGKVVNVILLDPSSNWTPPAGHIVIPAGNASPGEDIWNGQQFKKAPPEKKPASPSLQADGSDIAEFVPVIDPSIVSGDVVALAEKAGSMRKSNKPYDKNLIGVISTSPGLLLGTDENGNSQKLALTGQVPVKVTTENGPILIGDALTSSSKPGVAMKATKPGTIIGKALEKYPSAGSGQADPNAVGKIMIFVHLGWYDPDIYFASTGDLNIVKTENPLPGAVGRYIMNNSAGDVIDRIGAFGEIAAANIKAGFIKAEELAITGNVGIGTLTPVHRLDVADSQTASNAAAVARIFNTDTGTSSAALVLKLGNTSTNEVASTNHFINFETSGIGIVGSIQGNGGKGVTYATSGVADFAEYFKKDPNQNIAFGSVVCLNESGFAVACGTLNKSILGVASERPAFLGGENLGSGSVAVGLVGQVTTLVSAANGEIKPGDPLTASDTGGVAVKATKSGQIVGKALEAFKCPEPAEGPQCQGKILVSVNVGWYDPTIYIATDGTLGGLPEAVASIDPTTGSILASPSQTWQAQIASDATAVASDATAVASASASLAAKTNYVLENDSLFKDLQDKVSALQSKIELLSLQFEQQASTSGLLAQLGTGEVLGVASNATDASSSAELNLGDVEIDNATITGNLMVLGRTTVTTLGVTGTLSAGLLAIHGLDGEINTLSGNLYLQKAGLGGVDIFNGLIVMDTKGNLKVKGTVIADSIEASKYTVLGEQSIGSGTIPAGRTSVEVATSIATSSSKIFLTMTSLSDKQVTVIEKTAGKFKVAIPSPTTSPISFDWWIVGNK